MSEEQSGIVFDIKEFAVHDGPGIRTTVFLKGCPLSCTWCHNPEGIGCEAQVMAGASGQRVAGREYTAPELACLLNKQAAILRANDGGVTFSGGEPLMQAEFTAAVIDRLDGLHVLLDTSGYGSGEDFELLARRSSLVYFDLKLMDPALHRQYTGRDNAPILRNLQRLDETGIPYVLRVPLVPGVTDTEANLRAIADTARGLRGLLRVDLLPYNRAAGGKYAAAGMAFSPQFDESRAVNTDTRVFDAAGLEVHIRC